MSAPPAAPPARRGTPQRTSLRTTVRIAALRVEPYSIPFRRPFVTAGSALRERRGFVVRVQDHTGAWGRGEAAPLPAFGGERHEACGEALRAWAEALPGREVSLAGAPLELPAACGLAEERLTTHPVATHGLELALLDLAARRAGLPLARWLHPQAALAVAVNATLGAAAPEDAARAARDAVAAGFATLKLKVGVGGDDADEARVRAVREAVSLALSAREATAVRSALADGAAADVRLRVDANGAWTRERALAAVQRLAGFGLEYVEQPLPPDDLEGWVWLRERSPVPVAADESVRSVADGERLLHARAADVLVLKPMLLGGLLTTLRLARRSLAAGVPVVVTTVLEGAYGRLGALHAAAVAHAMHRESGLPRPPPACGLATGDLLAGDVAPASPAPARGRWALPEAAGLGLG